MITEYKSSLPDTGWSGAAEILDGFRRQLLLYAVIVADALGAWPASGRIVAASGQTLEIKIDPAACNAEADAAIAALDRLNEAVIGGTAAESLGGPSPSACTSCPFQIICPSFWQGLGYNSLQEMATTALDGVIERLEPGPDGDLYTAYMIVRAASRPANRDQAIVLRKSVHGELAPADVGGQFRLVHGRTRPDGRLGADLSTVVFALRDLPALETSSHDAQC